MRYTRLLAEALGLIIYGTAQIHDQPIHEVFDEAKKILSEVENCPERLFQNVEDVKYFKCGAPVDSPPYPECCTLRAGRDLMTRGIGN